MIDFSKTNQEILDSLNEVLNIPTGEKLRFNDIEKAFPDKGYLAMVAGAVLAAAKVDPEAQVVFNAASNGGADLSSKHAQEKVRAIAFAGKWPQELTTWILSRSTWTGPRWQHLGLPEPSLDWIQEQRKQFELQQAAKTLQPWFDAKVAVVNEKLFKAEITTIKQIQEIFAS